MKIEKSHKLTNLQTGFRWDPLGALPGSKGTPSPVTPVTSCFGEAEDLWGSRQASFTYLCASVCTRAHESTRRGGPSWQVRWKVPGRASRKSQASLPSLWELGLLTFKWRKSGRSGCWEGLLLAVVQQSWLLWVTQSWNLCGQRPNSCRSCCLVGLYPLLR